MNRLSPLLGMLVLAVAAGAQAQTPATTQDAKRDMQMHKQDPLKMQGSGAPSWSQLAGDKDAISKSDTLPNSWLALNFKACDKDRNGKVTREEYRNCRRTH